MHLASYGKPKALEPHNPPLCTPEKPSDNRPPCPAPRQSPCNPVPLPLKQQSQPQVLSSSERDFSKQPTPDPEHPCTHRTSRTPLSPCSGFPIGLIFLPTPQCHKSHYSCPLTPVPPPVFHCLVLQTLGAFPPCPLASAEQTSYTKPVLVREQGQQLVLRHDL